MGSSPDIKGQTGRATVPESSVGLTLSVPTVPSTRQGAGALRAELEHSVASGRCGFQVRCQRGSL